MSGACQGCGNWPETRPWHGELCPRCRPAPAPKPKGERKRRVGTCPPPKLDAGRAEELVTRYLDGEPVYRLAWEYDLSREGVYRYLRRAGVVIERAERVALRKNPTLPLERRWAIHELLTDAEWDTAYWGEDMPSMPELAVRLGLTRPQVEYALRAHDIPVRERSEQSALTWAKGRANACPHQQQGGEWPGGQPRPVKRDALLADLRARPTATIADLVRPGRGYGAVHAGLSDLVRRGLAERVSRGVYRAKED